METKRDFYVEMNKRRRELLTENIEDNNCISTALYLVGEREADTYIPCFTAESLLSNLKKNDKPELGNILVFEDSNKNLVHTAVVVQEAPLKLATRNGVSKPFCKAQLYDELRELYSTIGAYPAQFLIPSKLQKILEMEAQQ